MSSSAAPKPQPMPNSVSGQDNGRRPAAGVAKLVGRAARTSARRPKLMIALWLLLIVACTFGGSMAGTRNLSTANSGSGESGQAMQRMQQAGLLNRFNESVVVKSASSAETSATSDAVVSHVKQTKYVSAVSPNAATRDHGRTALVQVTVRGDPDQQANRVVPLESTVKKVATAHPQAYIGEAGDGSFNRADNNTISSGMQNAEMIAFPLTLLILIGAFGALVAAVVPLILGLTSVGAAIGALGLVSQIAPEGSTTSSVVMLMGLAVGVDYSLFYIRRERAERRNGAGPEAALMASAQTVGRAILIAGVTVVIGLAGLLFTGNPVFVSMALGAIVVVAIAVIGSLTVLPAMLSLLGDRVDKGRIWGRRAARRAANGTGAAARQDRGFWHGLATAVTKRPGFSAITAIVILTLLATPLLSMRLGNPGSQDLSPSNPTVKAQRLIDSSFDGGTDSAQLVVEGHNLNAHRTDLLRLGHDGRRAAGGADGQVSVDLARDGNTAVVNIPIPSGGLTQQDHNVQTLRSTLKPATKHLIPGATALITGDDASNVDFNHQMAVMIPIVIAFVLALAFLLLISTFRSAKLAIAVILLNLLSVGAAFGVLTELFQSHWAGQLLGLRSFGAIVDWLPLFAFVVLFGLSMDYTVLILERASEARRRGASAAAAAAEALGATGSTVTSAALVMVAVFTAFATVPLISFAQLGIGLAAAIAIDATIVRGIALPAVLTLLGDHGLPKAKHTRRSHDQLQAWDHRGHAVALETVSD
jgi:uncharacterized membrane protein YdfJ with MMPL/SSD domain